MNGQLVKSYQVVKDGNNFRFIVNETNTSRPRVYVEDSKYSFNSEIVKNVVITPKQLDNITENNHAR